MRPDFGKANRGVMKDADNCFNTLKYQRTIRSQVVGRGLAESLFEEP